MILFERKSNQFQKIKTRNKNYTKLKAISEFVPSSQKKTRHIIQVEKKLHSLLDSFLYKETRTGPNFILYPCDIFLLSWQMIGLVISLWIFYVPSTASIQTNPKQSIWLYVRRKSGRKKRGWCDLLTWLVRSVVTRKGKFCKRYYHFSLICFINVLKI